MIRINLLPFRAARKKENIRQQASIFLLSIIFVLMALVFYHLRLNSRLHETNTKIKTTQKQLAQYNKISREIALIKNKLRILNNKMNVIKQLESNRREPIVLMDTMTQMVIPKRMWFTTLGSKANTVSIKGNALDNKTVADFMTNLEESNLFASVNLQTLKKYNVEASNISLKQFEISCTKKISVPPQKAADAKAKKK